MYWEFQANLLIIYLPHPASESSRASHNRESHFTKVDDSHSDLRIHANPPDYAFTRNKRRINISTFFALIAGNRRPAIIAKQSVLNQTRLVEIKSRLAFAHARVLLQRILTNKNNEAKKKRVQASDVAVRLLFCGTKGSVKGQEKSKKFRTEDVDRNHDRVHQIGPHSLQQPQLRKSASSNRARQ